MKKKTRVFIVDDSFPKLPELIEQKIYEGAIGKDKLEYLTKEGEWGAEWNLRQLVVDLVASDHVKSGQIEISGYLNPAILLGNLKRNRTPDVIIYDWEYEANSYANSESWLLEILGEIPKAFIFVYTGVKDDVPTHLNKKLFEQFAFRFQLLAKGDSTNSVFTAEDFIYQYILSRVSNSNLIKIQGMDVKFEASGYLHTPKSILHLESILGRASLLGEIRKNNNEITEESVERIIAGIRGHMLINPEKGFLVTEDSTFLVKQFKPSVEISYLEAMKRFGLMKLREAIEVGFARV